MSGTGASAAGTASYGDMLVTSLVVLGVVCVAAFVAVKLFGRVLAGARGRGAGLMDVVARVPLEPRRSLYVVEVAGKTLLVGTSEMGLAVLSELDGDAVRGRIEERRVARGKPFVQLVADAIAKRRSGAKLGDARASASVGDAPAGGVANAGDAPTSGAASAGAAGDALATNLGVANAAGVAVAAKPGDASVAAGAVAANPGEANAAGVGVAANLGEAKAAGVAVAAKPRDVVAQNTGDEDDAA